MTIEELLTYVLLWFISGFEKLRNGEWLQLTIGQGVFIIVAGTFALVYVSVLCERLINLIKSKTPERKPGGNGWDDQ